MTDLEWKRPTPTGEWVHVATPEPGDVAIYRWDPNANAAPLGRVIILNRRQAFVYNLRRRIHRILERATRHD